jgi:hypothetical protein
MKNCSRITVCLLALLFVAGCASTKVSDRQQLVTGPLPRPDHILVYDFVATPADVPGDSELAGQLPENSAAQTPEQIEAGKKVGAEIAAKLVEMIRGMGMPAEHALTAQPQINDIVIRGYLLSVNEGSAGKRVGIGLGSGSSELKAVVEGYQMTGQGLRKLGSGTSDASGSKGPGTAVGLVTFLATRNPAGLIISGGMKVYGEASGKSKIEGRAEQTAKEIADILKKRFQEEGWIK